MGAMCGCNTNNNDIVGFWRNMGLRNLTFDAYKKIYEKNQRKWLSSGENKRSVDITRCEELFPLLDSVDFTDKQRKLYFDGLNDYINELSDKLTFFTSLSFFTRVNANEKDMNSEQKAENILDSIKNNEEKPRVHDVLFGSLIKMAIKRNDHDDVTKFFIEFVTEFPLQFVYVDKKTIEEHMFVYSKDNRDKLFVKVKAMNTTKFYEYMFNRDNVSHIHNDLLKIHADNSSDDLMKIRTAANVNQSNSTPGN